MKILKYLAISFFLFALIKCTSEGESKVKSLSRVDLSDFHAYAGKSPSGYVQITYKNESLRDVAANKLLGPNLDTPSNMYEFNSFEFFENKITYTYYLPGKEYITKFISDYEFRNDSLFVFKPDGIKIFAAIGNHDSLYMTKAIVCYPKQNSTERSIESRDKSAFTLDSVLYRSKYASLEDLTAGDTIAWCNVKYIYK